MQIAKALNVSYAWLETGVRNEASFILKRSKTGGDAEYPVERLTDAQKHIMHLALELIGDGQQLIQKGKAALEKALEDPQWADDVVSSGVKEIGKDDLSDLPGKTA